MKNFFNTTDIDTISESLNGEKFLTASRNEDGCIMLGFESANEDYVDTLTIKHDGSVVGAFGCEEEQQPQTVNDNQRAAEEHVKFDESISYGVSAEFHRAYADFLDAAELLAVDGQAVVTLAELARKCADAAQLNAYRLATRYPVMVRAALGLPDINYAEVPASDRVLILTPTTYTLLKQSKATFDNQDIGAELRKKGVIAQLDGLNVVKIASNRLPAKFGFMIAHPVATVAPVKLAEYKIHLDPPFLSGSLVEGRIYYDAFVLKNKAKGIYYQAIA